MRAVLFDRDDTRIGEAEIPTGCHLIEFDGKLFVRKPQFATLVHKRSGMGIVFDETTKLVIGTDTLERTPEKIQGRVDRPASKDDGVGG